MQLPESVNPMKFLLLVIVSASIALTACGSTGADGVCGNGERVERESIVYCVYEDTILIEEGFDCPADAPFGYQMGNTAVCASDADFDGDVADWIAEELPGSIDEGVQPGALIRSSERPDAYWEGGRPNDGGMGGHIGSGPTAGISDFDGDGYEDLFVSDRQEFGESTTLRGRILYGGERVAGSLAFAEEGTTVYGLGRDRGGPVPPPTSVFGDWDGDGLGDFVSAQSFVPMGSDGQQQAVLVYSGGIGRPPTLLPEDAIVLIDSETMDAADLDLQQVFDAGDIDGDGKHELVVRTYEDGIEPETHGIHIMQHPDVPGAEFSPTLQLEAGLLYPLLTGDFNGDGFADLLVYFESADARLVHLIWFGRSDGIESGSAPDMSFESSSSSEFARYGATCDVNLDGYADFILQTDRTSMLVAYGGETGLEDPSESTVLAPVDPGVPVVGAHPVMCRDTPQGAHLLLRAQTPDNDQGRAILLLFVLDDGLPQALSAQTATMIISAEVRDTDDGPEPATIGSPTLIDFDGDGNLDVATTSDAYWTRSPNDANRGFVPSRLSIFYGR